jgi:hypothetical protein
VKIKVLFLLTIAQVSFALEPVGFIRKIKGKMVIFNPKGDAVADTEGKRSRKIIENAPFYLGETLKTFDNTRVKIEFLEGGVKGKNESVLGPNTTLVITRAPSEKDLARAGTEIMLKDGQVRSDIKHSYSGKNTDQFLIKTPNAVAGVRGTVFSVFYDNTARQTQFAVEVGQVMASTANKSSAPIPLQTGMFTSTSSAGDANLSAPKPISQSPEIQMKLNNLKSEDSANQNSTSDSSKSVAKSNAPLARQPEVTTTERGPASTQENTANGNSSSALSANLLIKDTAASNAPLPDATNAAPKIEIRIDDLMKNFEQLRTNVNQNLSNSNLGKTNLVIKIR